MSPKAHTGRDRHYRQDWRCMQSPARLHAKLKFKYAMVEKRFTLIRPRVLQTNPRTKIFKNIS
jgi:hypothetical protein